jgi:hypothetical protein
MTTLGIAVLALAVLPFALSLSNLALYRRPQRHRAGDPVAAVAVGGVSIVIPARNEESSIRAAVESALASLDVPLEVVVVDDQSEDRTPAILRELADRDPRLRVVSAPPLPAGWNGKQHACAHGASVASHDLLVFVDADVRLSPDALARIAAFVESSGADLASGVPRQETGSFLERLVVPLIHVVLLGYLPMIGMRRSVRPSFAAGCGQLFAARRDAYRAVGGHGAVRRSRHDGVSLPRAFRRAGRSTDLFDATPVALCRMYRSAREVWDGFAKNALEGMAAPAAIGPWTVLLAGGHVLPFVLLAVAPSGAVAPATGVAAVAAALMVLSMRLILAWRFRQSVLGAVLHPVGVAVLLAIQFFALARASAGRPTAWKGRTQS